MSIPGSATPLLLATTAAAAPAAAFQVDRSLRFNEPDSAHLNRTPSSAGNRKTWTWSAWVKRANLGSEQSLFNAWSDNSNRTISRFNSSDQLQFLYQSGGTFYGLTTTQVFRDPSAWLHLVLVMNTSDATSTDRTQIYINGSRIADGDLSAFSTGKYPPQNTEYQVNSTIAHHIGARKESSAFTSTYLNAYLAEINFIDGQALAASDFGEYDDNNNWNPKTYAGVFGPRYSGETWSSAAADSYGFDGSTAYNSSATRLYGTSTYHKIVDAATAFTGVTSVVVGTSENVGNIKLDGTVYTTSYTSGVGLTVTSPPSSFSDIEVLGASNGVQIAYVRVNGELLIDSGVNANNSFKLNFSDNSSNEALGYDQSVATPSPNPDGGMDVVTYAGNGSTQTISGLAFQPDFVWIKSRSSGTEGHYIANSVNGLTENMRSNANNAEQTNTNGVTDAYANGFTLGNSGRVNGSSQNYVAWCWKAGGTASANSDGSINSQTSVSTDYGFSIVTYTGNGSTGTVGHGLSSTPKWIVVKNRSAAASWFVYHVGVTSGKGLNLNNTEAEFTPSQAGITAVSDSTFSLGSARGETNASSENYVAYSWSEVSGFSKFGSYTGNGSSTGPTVTTGFKPRYVLIKRTDSAGNWGIYDTERSGFTDNNKTLLADTSGSESTDNNKISITSTGFNPASGYANVNANGGTYVYAAFADRPGNNFDVNNLVANTHADGAAGFDAVTYSGTGSAQSISGLKFQPDLVWLKRRDSAGNHNIQNSIRGASAFLQSDYNGAEMTSGSRLSSFDSNGFTLTSDNGGNASGGSYVAWCWDAGANSNKTYTVKVVSDSGNKYRFDDFGTSAVTLDLQEGSTYVFDQSDSSNAGHPIRFGTSANGTDYTTGVTHTGTPGSAGAKTTLVLGTGVTTLYYSCANHSGMGGQINTNSTAGASNFDGSIQSVAKANNTYGFSVLTYTGTSASSNTIGHGLGSAPKWIIVKSTSDSDNWFCYHIGLDSTSPEDYDISLNSTGARRDFVSWNDTKPTNSVFSVGNTGATNENGRDYLAYCWSEVAGFSKFGSYTGTGSANVSVATGFKPAFVIIKESTNTNSWYIYDTARGTTNILWAQSSSSESSIGAGDGTNQNALTVTDTGFTIPHTLSGTNRSGGTYIYAAFAGTPDTSDVDSLIDTPTNYEASSGNNGGNYCTLNPLAKGATTPLSNGNLNYVGGAAQQTLGTIGMSSGKWYWEDHKISGTYGATGIALADAPLNNHPGQGNSWAYNKNGSKWHNGSYSSYGDTWDSGDTIGIAFDADAGTLVFYKNGVSQGTAFTGLTNGPYFVTGADNSVTGYFNFGASGSFKYTPPTGHKSLCTQNLPDPTIADGSTAMDAKLYTGNGSTQTISGLGFSPDLVWMKMRSTAGYSHKLVDQVRGATKSLVSNNTNAELTETSGLTAFTSDGFSLGSQDPYNRNNDTFVAWTWDAGTSTVNNNTDGSITPTGVRANASAGFSIVAWTGTSSNETVGHGLNAAPGLIIAKARNEATFWPVYHSSLGRGGYFALEDTYAGDTAYSDYWGDAEPTNAVFGIKGNSGNNRSGKNMLAYCFAPVAGYSAFGSYTGNGSTDGTFVYTGFRPKFLLVKGNANIDWIIEDSSRDTFNQMNKRLYPNDSVAESTSSNGNMDFLSNGFKPRTTHLSLNSNGTTYYYAAFAEHPFKTARAR